MREQAFIVSLYAQGERRPSDCIPDFLATRADAHEQGKRWLCDSGAIESQLWAVRYTVRKIIIDV